MEDKPLFSMAYTQISASVNMQLSLFKSWVDDFPAIKATMLDPTAMITVWARECCGCEYL
jgi:hypothetical protein